MPAAPPRTSWVALKRTRGGAGSRPEGRIGCHRAPRGRCGDKAQVSVSEAHGNKEDFLVNVPGEYVALSLAFAYVLGEARCLLPSTVQGNVIHYFC